MKVITAKQCRAARGLLEISQPDLAQRCGVHVQTISNFEHGSGTPSKRTLEKISNALELSGIEFIDGGVREVENLTIMSGHEGFSAFLDDVHQTAQEHGTKKKPCKIFISNVVHDNWIKWMGPKKWAGHVTRMEAIKDLIDIRIIVAEGDWSFPAETYSKYRWFPKNLFNDKSFYSYNDKLAFLNFREDDVSVTVMRQSEFAEGYRTLFEIAWDHVASSPKK